MSCMKQITLTLSGALGISVPFIPCVIYSLLFVLQLGFVGFSFRIWSVVFFSLSHLSPVGLFCECCRMSLL